MPVCSNAIWRRDEAVRNRLVVQMFMPCMLHCARVPQKKNEKKTKAHLSSFARKHDTKSPLAPWDGHLPFRRRRIRDDLRYRQAHIRQRALVSVLILPYPTPEIPLTRPRRVRESVRCGRRWRRRGCSGGTLDRQSVTMRVRQRHRRFRARSGRLVLEMWRRYIQRCGRRRCLIRIWARRRWRKSPRRL